MIAVGLPYTQRENHRVYATFLSYRKSIFLCFLELSIKPRLRLHAHIKLYRVVLCSIDYYLTSAFGISIFHIFVFLRLHAFACNVTKIFDICK